MNEEHRNRRRPQQQSVLQRLFLAGGWFRFLPYALLGFILVISLHAGMVVATDKANVRLNVEQTGQSTHAVSQSLQSTATVSPAQLVHQAEDHYQAGQLTAAIALWQRAADGYEQNGDRLNQALVLSFLATALDNLGQWTQAQGAIDHAITLLKTQNSAANPEASSVLAQVLTAQGELPLIHSQTSEAFATWQVAEVNYRQATDPIGILGSQINQARALQSEGLYRRSSAFLTQVEQSVHNQPDIRLKVTGLRNLGKVLRLVSNLAQSRAVLEQSLAILQRRGFANAEKLDDNTPRSTSELSGILFSLGNTTRAQGETATALNFYQKAVVTAPLLTAKTQVQLAQLSLLVESDRRAEVQRLLSQIQSELAKLPPGRLAAYARINLAQSLIRMKDRGAGGAGEVSSQFLGGAAQGHPNASSAETDCLCGRSVARCSTGLQAASTDCGD